MQRHRRRGTKPQCPQLALPCHLRSFPFFMNHRSEFRLPRSRVQPRSNFNGLSDLLRVGASVPPEHAGRMMRTFEPCSFGAPMSWDPWIRICVSCGHRSMGRRSFFLCQCSVHRILVGRPLVVRAALIHPLQCISGHPSHRCSSRAASNERTECFIVGQQFRGQILKHIAREMLLLLQLRQKIPMKKGVMPLWEEAPPSAQLRRLA